MSQRILWAMVSGMVAVSLMMAACGPAATPTTPTTPTAPATPTSPATPTTPTAPTTPTTPTTPVIPTPSAKPGYGGVITLARNAEQLDFDSCFITAGGGSTYTETVGLTNQSLWEGDWTKGVAGGYGTKETDWADTYDSFTNKVAVLAESITWTVDEAKNTGTIVYKIRKGVHWGLNPNSEASRLVNGREFTADDVISEFKRATSDSRAYIYRGVSELRGAEITKSGPWEINIKVPLSSLITAIARFGDAISLHPPEVIKRYGDANRWYYSVGTGPFILSEYVPGSAAYLKRNPNYWETDPVGPGKGNHLPYLDGVRILTIPDASTRLAAVRTGKVDQIVDLLWEDAEQLQRTAPSMKMADGGIMSGIAPTYINTTRKPFTDVRVRRALMMATDLNAIRQHLNYGRGQIQTTPYPYVPEYAAMYLSYEAPDAPPSVKELYVYNPEKAKQLLKEAGYPSGFKTTVLIVAADVDYYSIIKDMWAKVGIDLALDVREAGPVNSLRAAGVRNYDLSPGPHAPASMWYAGSWIYGLDTSSNLAQINDPYINEMMPKLNRALVIDGEKAAMEMMRELMKYVLDQAYAIPRPRYNRITMWWPWIMNYSGEVSIGFHNAGLWTKYAWLDRDLKKSKGF